MASYKTLGIVLKSNNFGEADRLLTILTERFGKVKAIAKGVRKIKSHMAGALEPFMKTHLLLHEGKTFFTITGAVIEKSFIKVHTDLRKMGAAFLMGEIIDKFLQENQKIPEIFDYFLETLERLEKTDRSLIISAFELKIAHAAGFKPELYHCVICKGKITPQGNCWDNLEGGVICKKCHLATRKGKEISDQAIKLLRFFEQKTLVEVEQLSVPEEILVEAEEVLSGYLKTILERDLKSKQFLNLVKEG